MALRGETVGTAYVRILADGSGLPGSIQREMDDVEPGLRKSGAEHSRAYEEGWNAESKKNSTLEKGLKAKLERAFGKIDADAAVMARGLEEKIARGITAGLDDGTDPANARKIGERVAKSMADGFTRTGTLTGNIRGEIDKALNGVIQDTKDFETQWRRTFDTIENDTIRTLKNMSKNAAAEDIFAGLKKSVGGLKQAVERDFFDTFRRIGPEAEKGGNWIRRLGDRVDVAGNKIAKGFGKGSRNNFVNFFAGFVQAPIEIIGKLAQGIGDLVSNLSQAQSVFSKAGGGLDGLLAVGKQLGPAAGNVLLMAGAIGGLVLIMGPVASLISGIAGAIFALASAVASAMAAGLGVMAGLLAPIAVGIGTIALAFTKMDKATKDSLKKTLKPLIDDLKTLQGLARGGILAGLKNSGKDLEDSMGRLGTLVSFTSSAIGDVIRSFAQATTSAGFKNFLDVLTLFVPDAIRQIGEIAKNVLGGLGGIIQGSLPITQQFLDYIEKITGKFSDWANTVAGQASIKDFFSRAAESAKSLWDLLVKVGEALGLLLFNKDAQAAGGSILDSMTGQVQNFIDYLKANPDALKNWFADAKDIATKVGDAVKRLAQIFDELDTPENRKAVSQILGALVTALGLVRGAAGLVSGAMRGFSNILDAIPFLGTIKDIGRLIGAIRNIIPALKSAAGAISSFASSMVSSIRGAVQRAGQWLADLPAKARAQASRMAAAGSALASAFVSGLNNMLAEARALPGKIVGFFRGLGSRIASAIGSIHINWPKPPAWLSKVMPGMASGGLAFGPQLRLIGEAGPEAVVPLNRPLSQVDPAVRQLSAIAQGLRSPIAVTRNANGRSVDVGGITIITPTKDPGAVAQETINRLVASSLLA